MNEAQWTASPEASGDLGDDSRLDFNFDAIDADIALDDSLRTNASMLARLPPDATAPSATANGKLNVLGMINEAEGSTMAPKRTIDRWSTTAGKPAAMTLKEQEQTIATLKKENFSFKCKVYFLEERLEKMSPEHADQALQENVDLKVRLRTTMMELAQFKRLVTEANAAIEALEKRTCDQQHGMSEEEEDEFNHALKKVAEYEAALRNADQQLQEYEEDILAREAELTELQKQLQEKSANQGLQEERDTYKEQADNYAAQILELQQQIASLEAKDDEEYNRAVERAKEADKWEAKFRELEQKLDAANGTIADLEKDLSASQSVKDRLSKEVEDMRASHVEEMNFEMELHQDELAKANIWATDLASQLDDAQEHQRQLAEIHENDIATFSERWTLDRQELRDQLNEAKEEAELLRVENERLVPHINELLAWREEDAARHDQEMGDLVSELEEKVMDVDRLSNELHRLRNFEYELQDREERIDALEAQIRSMELVQKEMEAVHDEVIDRMKSKMSGSGSVSKNGNHGGSLQLSALDLRTLREQIERAEKQNHELEVRLQVEAEKRQLLEEQQDDRSADQATILRMAQEHSDIVEELQERLVAATDRLADLNQILNERDTSLVYYKDQLEKTTRQSEELHERYLEVEFRLSSELEGTTNDLLDLRREIAEIKASRASEGERTLDQSEEMERLTTKIRKLTGSVAAMESERSSMEETLRDRATTIAMLRSRLNELELQVSRAQRREETPVSTTSATTSAAATKDEIVERNALLLTVMQHLESILGGDSRLDVNMLPNPSANFTYFSTHLVSRLKGLGKLFVLFEKRSKELEDKAFNQHSVLRKQLDAKLKQMDRFETIVRTAADRQRKWREQLVKKQGDMEELQAKNLQLTTLLNDKRTQSVSSERIQDYEVRIKHAERKFQLENKRYLDKEERWNARLRELEKRTNDAEEKVKRERQGAKEKVAGLLDESKAAQKSIDTLQRKNSQLQQQLSNHQKSAVNGGGV